MISCVYYPSSYCTAISQFAFVTVLSTHPGTISSRAYRIGSSAWSFYSPIMILLADVVDRLLEHEDLYNQVSFVQITAFLELVSRFLPMLDLVSPRRRIGLPALPDNIAHLLSMGTDLPPERIADLWLALGPILMEGEAMTIPQADVDAALATYAPPERLGGSISSPIPSSPVLSRFQVQRLSYLLCESAKPLTARPLESLWVDLTRVTLPPSTHVPEEPFP